MYWPWLFAFGLEAAWLEALWFVVPESRPWDDEGSPGPTSAPGLSWARTGVLYGYTFYHLPGILLAGLFYVLSGGLFRGKRFPFQRVGPRGFLVLAVINGFYLGMAWMMFGI